MKLGILIAIAMSLLLGGSAYASQPNIVLLLADDLGYGELGCYGHQEIPTPHIDSLADLGVRFEQGYVTAPNCSPSRAGLMTGRIPTRFGYEFNPIGARNDETGIGLPTDQKTIAELLHDAGYATGLVGKWHLGGTAPFHPQRRGFDEFYGFLHEGHYYVPPPWPGVTTMLRRRTLPGGGVGRWTSGRLIYSTHMGHDEPPYDANNPILRGSQPISPFDHLTEEFTREAIEFIERHSEQPFFLFVSYSAVHSPLQGADRYMQRFQHIEDVHRRIFAAMLSQLDDSVGSILAKLRERQLHENTMVIFLSDNGGPTRELTSRNTPLRGGKGDLWEGGLRVPFVLRWPGKIPAKMAYVNPVSSLDLLPTIAAAAQTAIPAHMDGVNLIPFLSQPTTSSPHEHLYWRQGSKTALRRGDWKMIRQPGGPRLNTWVLFNLAEDVSESNDLARRHPEKLAELLAIWEKLDGEMAEPLF